MNREPLIMLCTSDISGQVRGKAFPANDLPRRLKQGIGWTPTNIQITTFRNIADSPFGALGDLQLMPDPDSEVNVDFGDGSAAEHFFLTDIYNTDGTAWDCCLRGFLKSTIAKLEQKTGLRVQVAFEHEFHYSGGDNNPASAYALRAFRQQGIFGEALTYALNSAGLKTESFMAEYGPNQYEITIAPECALKAADQAIVLRELTRATAHRLGESVSFSPLVTPEVVGNGVHIHMSLHDQQGNPVTYDAQATHGVAETAGQFIAGILHHTPSIIACTAPSIISYRRLVPHRWSSAYNNLGYRDREACVRLCPIFATSTETPAQQFNFEFRAADAAASPYLQLAVLLQAGLDGVMQKRPTPPITESDLETMSHSERAKRRIRRLPRALEQALDRLETDEAVAAWFPPQLLDIYLRHKWGEIELLRHLSADEKCEKYSQVY